MSLLNIMLSRQRVEEEVKSWERRDAKKRRDDRTGGPLDNATG